ncbi:hypothetical protein FSARC_4881 [Fusarium sarcochroum]|uniref:Uncharacterized protein n=1 Tax=Fusarium sarcochroum TaxID=1208366 RepID=A0A8H4U131_9HYPO|nr:hypothetical protein FSARC_4881 [Fusarium sarcochroum]
MRFTTTIVVALQASTGIAHCICPGSKKHIEGQDDQAKDLSATYKKYVQGYQKTKIIVTHKYLDPKAKNHGAQEKDDEHNSTPFKVKDHDSKEDDSYHKTKGYGNKVKINYILDSAKAEAEEHDDKDEGDEDEIDPKYKLHYKVSKTWRSKGAKTAKNDDEKDVDYKTIHRHRFDIVRPEALKTNTKTPKLVLSKGSSHKNGAKSADDHKSPVIVKIGPGHDDRKHNTVYPRDPCKKTKKKEEKEEKEEEKKPRDPNAPLPRLNSTHLVNIERIPRRFRQRIAEKMPFDEETKKEFIKMDKLTPELVVKLNEVYVLIVDDPDYKAVIKFLKKENKRSVAPELTKAQLKRLEGTGKFIREAMAKKLDMNKGLAQEFIKAKKFTPELIKKLNKEWARIQGDAKYSKMVARIKQGGKRGAVELTKKQIKKLEEQHTQARSSIAKKLDFDQDLTKEFVKAKKFTPGLINKLNAEYDRVHRDPKYQLFVQIMKDFKDQSMVARFKRDNGDEKDEKHKELKNDEKNEKKSKKLKVIGEDLREEAAEDFQKYKGIVTKFVKTAQSKGSPDNDATKGPSEKQVKPPKKKSSKTHKVADEKLKKKMEKTKENGWCPEFMHDLNKTLGESGAEEDEDEEWWN